MQKKKLEKIFIIFGKISKNERKLNNSNTVKYLIGKIRTLFLVNVDCQQYCNNNFLPDPLPLQLLPSNSKF